MLSVGSGSTDSWLWLSVEVLCPSHQPEKGWIHSLQPWKIDLQDLA